MPLLVAAAAAVPALKQHAAAATLWLPPELAFNVTTYTIVVVYGLMILAPQSKLVRHRLGSANAAS